MAKERVVVYLEAETVERLKSMSAVQRGETGVTISEAIDLLWQKRSGNAMLVELYDGEMRNQFDHVVKNNDMSPEDTIRKIIRREYYDMVDRGSNQRNIVRHVYVLLRIAVFLLIEIAKQNNIVFSPTPQEQQALRDTIPVALNREGKSS